MGPKRRLLVLLTSASLLAAIFPAAAGAATPIPTTYPRDETLYTSGTMWALLQRALALYRSYRHSPLELEPDGQ